MRIDTEDGASLVEVLVAFVILSGAILVSFQAFQQGMKRYSAVQDRMREVEVARYEIERLKVSGVVRAGSQAGLTDGISWKVDITELPGGARDADIIRPLLLRVWATAEGSHEKSQSTLETIILTRAHAP